LALYTRAAMLEALSADYVRTAWAKGLSGKVVAWSHAMRNASIPVLTLAGLQLPHVVEGSVVIEAVYSWPGIGFLTVASVGRRDYPVLLVITILVGCAVVVANFLADVLHHYLDPRLDYS
jgi:peptide/nickel transport system permease protein